MGWQSALLAMQAKRVAGLAEAQRLTALRAVAALALIGSAGLGGGFGRVC